MTPTKKKHASRPKSRPGTPWHGISAEEALARLGGDDRRGLSTAEADRRRREFGENRLTTRRGPGPLRRFLLQFHQPLLYILLAAGAGAAMLGETVDASVIFGVVLVNAVAGYIQEAKALSALSALARSMVAEAKVLRDGAWRAVPAEELVPGDVVRLRSGDKVPADLRLSFTQSLRLDESMLTGESAPVDKSPAPVAEDAPLAEQTCLVFAATVVTSGQGHGVVAATGDTAAIGRIATLTAEADDLETPLTQNIAKFSRVVLYGILALAGLTVAVGLGRGQTLASMFMAAVALAVGAIPEGLPAAVTVILAIGVSRMAARRAVIRRLPAVETLGSTTVICTDKTGTLTQNRMTVTEIYAGGVSWSVAETDFTPTASSIPHIPNIPDAPNDPDGPGDERTVREALFETLRAGVLCNDATPAGSETEFAGDPTETALLTAARKAGLRQEEEGKRLPRLADVPFESERMYMATLHENGPSGPRLLYFKGSTETVLARCRDALGFPLDADRIGRTVEAMGRRGLRVLALARKTLPKTAQTIAPGDLEGGLTFLGLVGMIDPPRPEAVAAVAVCRRAGIMVKMITGDHAATATAVGAALDLAGGGEIATLNGREIETLPDAALPRLAENTQVFARVSPEQKLRLVKALQSLGHVTAMTGDGVNDAPALRQADIGVAMGQGGAEAAKEAADMVLTDDNFATIEAAVEEGRGVFDNLTKCIVWTLPTNVGEGLIVLAAVLSGTELPISPVQILWINMTTAGSLGLLLAFEPKEPGVMARAPRDPRRPILGAALARRVLLVGAALLAAAFGIFEWELAADASREAARTAAVNVFVAAEAFYLLNCRSLTRPALSMRLGDNPFVLWGMAGAIGLQLLFTYAPFMHSLFGSAAIGPMVWLRVVGAAAAVFLLVEAEKRFFPRA
ncbi:MAG: HAD-IC family P-type ATPase [Solidesulfovibrio sp.]